MEEKFKQFTRPLVASEIEWKVQSYTKGATVRTIVVPYIDNRAVMNRLDKVFGHENWSSEFQEFGDGVLCKLSVRCDDVWVTKSDGADKTDIEATKGGISDSMKRASTQWGLGRELYDYPRVMINGQITYINKQLRNLLDNIDTSKDVVILDDPEKK